MALEVGSATCSVNVEFRSVHNVEFWLTLISIFRLRIAPSVLRTLMVQAAFSQEIKVKLGLSKNLMRHNPQNISVA